MPIQYFSPPLITSPHSTQPQAKIKSPSQTTPSESPSASSHVSFPRKHIPSTDVLESSFQRSSLPSTRAQPPQVVLLSRYVFMSCGVARKNELNALPEVCCKGGGAVGLRGLKKSGRGKGETIGSLLTTLHEIKVLREVQLTRSQKRLRRLRRWDGISVVPRSEVKRRRKGREDYLPVIRAGRIAGVAGG